MLTVPSVIIPGSTIALIGEAPGADEERLGRPFVGASGQELRAMCNAVGINFDLCSLFNVFSTRPPRNDIEAYCVSKKELPKDYPFQQLRTGKYFRPELLELDRLRNELTALNPVIIVALGNTAVWAVCGSAKISAMRGYVHASTLCQGIKVLPTFHPAAVLRQYEMRPIVLADLQKVVREAEYREIRRPRRTIFVDPTLEDVSTILESYLRFEKILSVDIETKHGMITHIGFSPRRDEALVIPFVDERQPDYSYWRTLEEELLVWQIIKRVLEHPITKLYQNGLYDIQWKWRMMGLASRGEIHDTSLIHHSLQPELQKSLGFMGSIYTDEASWKGLRKTDMSKREE